MTLSQEQRDRAQAICTEIKDSCERIHQRVNELNELTLPKLEEARGIIRTLIRGLKW
jgi:hypothetical protein